MGFKPQCQLRSNVLKDALKSFIVPLFTKRYQVCAIRAIWPNTDNENVIWRKRRELECMLSTDKNVVAFFSCVCLLNDETIKKKRKKREEQADESGESDDCQDEEEGSKIKNGLSFWIVFNAPEVLNNDFENLMTKRFLICGLDVKECKALKPRGINILF